MIISRAKLVYEKSIFHKRKTRIETRNLDGKERMIKQRKNAGIWWDKKEKSKTRKIDYKTRGGARGVMVIVAGIGHGDTSSNPGLIAFHIALIPLGKVWIQLFSLQQWVNSRAD